MHGILALGPVGDEAIASIANRIGADPSRVVSVAGLALSGQYDLTTSVPPAQTRARDRQKMGSFVTGHCQLRLRPPVRIGYYTGQ